MGEENRVVVVPDFSGWGIQEVKKSVLREALRLLKQNGIRGLAVLLTVVGLVWIAGQLINSPLGDALKVFCVLGVSAALLCVALVALLTEKGEHATAKQSGRDRPNQPGTESGNEGATGPAASVNGRTLDGGGH